MQTLSKRSFIKTLAATALAAPLLGFSRSAKALSVTDGAGIAGAPVTSPLWTTLARATDGTDPSTATGALPRFTTEIRALENTQVELTGYIQSLGGRFGRQEYLLSSAPFHCPFCYAAGRGSLVRVFSKQHLEDTDDTVTVRGTVALQDKDPDEFYYTLNDAVII